MHMTKRVTQLLVTSALIFCAAARPVSAQSYGGWSYEWSMPMGDLEEYIDNDSWLGWSIEGRWFTSDNLAFGAQLGYYEFYTNTLGTINLPQGAISGDQYRHLFSVPFMVGLYLYGSPGETRPYVGVSAGAYYFDQDFDIGAFSLEDTEWLFGVAPEVGLTVGRGPGAVALHARYHYPMNGGNFLTGDARSFQYLSVGVSMFYRKGY
jgi:hypothetical protein